MDSDLSKAVDELFAENVEGLVEGDYAEHPDTWVKYGFDEGPAYIITGDRDRIAVLEKFADQDDDEPLTELEIDVDRETLFQLWKWLVRGELEKIKAAYPDCGW